MHDYPRRRCAASAAQTTPPAAPRRQRLRAPWATPCRKRAVHGAAGRAVRGRSPRRPPPRRATRRRSAGRVRIRDEHRHMPLHVITDVLDVVINLKGGELDQADLLEYPLRKDTPNIPVRLLSREPPADSVSAAERTRSAPPAKPRRRIWPPGPPTEKIFRACAADAEELRVPLTWTDGQGLTVTKTFVFKRGQYAIDLIYDVKNAGGAPRKLAPYSQIPAPLGTCIALLFRCRDLFVQGAGRLRRHQVPGSERRERHRLQISRRPSPMAGWPRCSINSSSAIVPPADQPYQVPAAGSRQRIPAERHRPHDRRARGRQGAVPRRAVRRPQIAVAARGDWAATWSAPSTSAF